MGAPRKFDQETRERAVRMYHDRLKETGEPKLSARKRVGGLLDINPGTLRNWIEKDAPIDSEQAAKTVAEHEARMRALRREVAELRRANQVLKTASAFFAAAEVDRRPR